MLYELINSFSIKSEENKRQKYLKANIEFTERKPKKPNKLENL